MRTLLLGLSLLLPACACNDAPMHDNPEWSGPPVVARFQPDGSLAVVLTAPTASHTLDLGRVALDGDTAEVYLDHTTPGSAYVAQIVTDVTAAVPQDRLAKAKRARVWIATRVRGAEVGTPLLAAVVTRP